MNKLSQRIGLPKLISTQLIKDSNRNHAGTQCRPIKAKGSKILRSL